MTRGNNGTTAYLIHEFFVVAFDFLGSTWLPQLGSMYFHLGFHGAMNSVVLGMPQCLRILATHLVAADLEMSFDWVAVRIGDWKPRRSTTDCWVPAQAGGLEGKTRRTVRMELVRRLLRCWHPAAWTVVGIVVAGPAGCESSAVDGSIPR